MTVNTGVVSASGDARVDELDRALPVQEASEDVAAELFAVVDAITAQPALRRALTDPGVAPDARRGLVDRLFGGRVSATSVGLVRTAVALRWTDGRSFLDALERQGARAALLAALNSGRLDSVEDELFRFGRLVDATSELRTALADRTAPMDARTQLVSSLLDGKVDPVTLQLARRAVHARQRTFALTIEQYLAWSAAARRRSVAVVQVARPLTSEQEERLRVALTRQVGQEVSLHVILDPSIMGGIRVAVGNEIIEGTVAGRLEQVRRQLSE